MNLLADTGLLTWAVALAAIVAVLGFLAALAKPTPSFAKKRFLTENEARFLTLLEAALPQHRIMAQVAMGALLKAGESNGKKAHSARNAFAQKIVDYTVVTRDSAEVLFLIELDDRTHNAVKDARRDAMTAAAGYRTIRIPSRPRPTGESVRAAVAELLQSSARAPQGQG